MTNATSQRPEDPAARLLDALEGLGAVNPADAATLDELARAARVPLPRALTELDHLVRRGVVRAVHNRLGTCYFCEEIGAEPVPFVDDELALEAAVDHVDGRSA